MDGLQAAVVWRQLEIFVQIDRQTYLPWLLEDNLIKKRSLYLHSLVGQNIYNFSLFCSLNHVRLLKTQGSKHLHAKKFILLQCIHGIWEADGTHQTSIYSPWTFKHLPHLRTKVCVPVCYKSVSRVCGQQVTACFTSASIANRLPYRLKFGSQYLMKGNWLKIKFVP